MHGFVDLFVLACLPNLVWNLIKSLPGNLRTFRSEGFKFVSINSALRRVFIVLAFSSSKDESSMHQDFSEQVCYEFYSVAKRTVNVLLFVVRLDPQKCLDFAPISPSGGGKPGRVKEKKAKTAEKKNMKVVRRRIVKCLTSSWKSMLHYLRHALHAHYVLDKSLDAQARAEKCESESAI